MPTPANAPDGSGKVILVMEIFGSDEILDDEDLLPCGCEFKVSTKIHPDFSSLTKKELYGRVAPRPCRKFWCWLCRRDLLPPGP
jgi:hypothetical protein